MKTQKCTLCDEPSLSGIKPGQGKCQYHWIMDIWGKEWADYCRDVNIIREVEDTEKITVDQARAAQRLIHTDNSLSHKDYEKATNIIYRYDMQGLKLWKEIEEENNA